jgi:hypothetical protein
MDVQEETSGVTRMQQWHKEPRPKSAIMSGKQENTQQDLQAHHRTWRSQSKQSGLPSDCEKLVSGHCGGVGPLRNEGTTNNRRKQEMAVHHLRDEEP